MHYSAQPKGYPPLGTMMGLITAFAIGEFLEENRGELSMECFQYGRYKITVTPNNKEFVEFNTPLRNAIKERLFVEEDKKANTLDLMIDGGDWIRMGELMNHVLGLWGYSARDLPTRVYTPIIRDLSRAKFSKSLYVKKEHMIISRLIGGRIQNSLRATVRGTY